MRFGIVGAGSLGSVYGGFLHAAEREVHLYETDEEVVDAINGDGIRIDRPEGDSLVVEPPATTDPSAVDPVDVLFLFTKAFDTEQAMRDAEPMVDATTRVVTLQNGVTNVDVVSEYVPRDRIVSGYTRAGANTVGPGHVRFLGTDGSVIGGEDRETARSVAAALTDAGLTTTVVDDPVPHIWKKQFRNVARKPISALTELRNGPQVEYEGTREVARHLIEEAVEVARAKDVAILPEDPVADFLQPGTPEKYDKKSSILEDVENERPTEIAQINGAVVTYGEAEDVDTPYNRMATNLVTAKEYSYLDEPTR